MKGTVVPDKSGKLSAQDKKTIDAWLGKHWSIGRTCPISGGSSWTVADDLIGMPIVDNRGQPTTAGSYPQVMLVCEECGYTRTFNAMVMGIVKAA
jgi:hypothetical protein